MLVTIHVQESINDTAAGWVSCLGTARYKQGLMETLMQVTQSLQPDLTKEPVSESAASASEATSGEPSIIREPEHVVEEVTSQFLLSRCEGVTRKLSHAWTLPAYTRPLFAHGSRILSFRNPAPPPAASCLHPAQR